LDVLSGKVIAVIAMDGVEETEPTEPVKALRETGAKVEVISNAREPIQAFRHQDKSIEIDVDRILDEGSPSEYDALLLPRGALNADAMRLVVDENLITSRGPKDIPAFNKAMVDVISAASPSLPVFVGSAIPGKVA
jgi:putative intracellular protease/amidase